MKLTVERQLGDFVRGIFPGWFGEFVMFGLKQAWACLFGGLFLAALIISSLIWQDDWLIHRYDALFGFAVFVQAIFLVLKLETLSEAKVILLFHIVGTAMEVFKLRMGSWSYPEPCLIQIASVPLFSGFMYASVGSFMARVIRIFDMKFAPYPPFWVTIVLALLIYINFFSHHFIMDLRVGLMLATVIVFWRTRIWFYITEKPLWMPLPVAAFLASIFLWLAENIGTITGTWIYNGHATAHFVGWGKWSSWYMLLFVSFMLVTIVFRDVMYSRSLTEAQPKQGIPKP